MRISGLSHYALSGCVAVAMLVACGGLHPPIGATGGMQRAAAKKMKVFSYTGKRQEFKVPAGATQITVMARGASGPSFGSGGNGGYTGGEGGVVTATISVTPGETLAIFVGGEGGSTGVGGFNGGGFSCGDSCGSGGSGTGGGGASDVRQNGDGLLNRAVVAGGGGGGGINSGYGAGAGGAGGGDVGGRGGNEGSSNGFGGRGGTQVKGGKGGRGGERGGQTRQCDKSRH